MEEEERQQEYSFMGLFFALFGLIAVTPLLHGEILGAVVLTTFFTLIFISCIYALSFDHRVRTIGIVLAIPTTLLSWFHIVNRTPLVDWAAPLSQLLFFLYVILVMSRYVFRERRVTQNLIFGALCVYLVIGLSWGLVYDLTELGMPDAFTGRLDDTAGTPNIEELIYFSFVTLTTLGYGDIVPLSGFTRSLSVIEALSGQFYIAVILARMIALATKPAAHRDR